ncbi:MAG TPA: hypothetical protein VGM06_10575 [Polyangiaceae bacterium]
MQEEMAREKTFNMRLTAEEVQTFEMVAGHYGLPVASMLRMLVKKEHREILAESSVLADTRSVEQRDQIVGGKLTLKIDKKPKKSPKAKR